LDRASFTELLGPLQELMDTQADALIAKQARSPGNVDPKLSQQVPKREKRRRRKEDFQASIGETRSFFFFSFLSSATCTQLLFQVSPASTHVQKPQLSW